MSLKRLKKIFYNQAAFTALLFGMALVVAGFLFWKTYDHSKQQVKTFFVPRSVTFTIKHVYSDTRKQEIIAFIQAHTDQQSLINFDPKDFYKKLQATFGMVTSMTWSFNVDRVLHMVIQGAEPCCIINNDLVLAENKRVFVLPEFKDFDLSKLPKLSMNLAASWVADGLPARVFDFVTRIPSKYYQRFTISYKDQHRVELTPQQSICKFAIVSDEKSLFESNKIEAIGRIFNDLQKRGLVSQKILRAKIPLLAFDVRFKDRVVVRFFDNIKRGMGS